MKTPSRQPHAFSVFVRSTRARRLAGITIAALIGTVAAPVASAGLAEDIKSKVNNINTLTGRVNTRTSSLVTKADEQTQRLDELASTLNTVIAETDIIKASMAPIAGLDDTFENFRGLKDRFSDIQFDPAEVLEGDQISSVVDRFKAQKQAAEERLNDPDLEVFRGELVSTLRQIRQLVNDGSPLADLPSPLENLVEVAPPPVLAVLKFATGPVLPELSASIQELWENTQRWRDLGMKGKEFYDYVQCLDDKATNEAKLVVAYKSSQNLIDTIARLKLMYQKIEVQEWELGIHGYTSVKVTTGDDARDHTMSMIVRFEAMKAEIDLKREKLNFERMSCDFPG